jgi:hypothetical protein
MYAMNIQTDVIGIVLRENCKSKQMTDFIAWPSRCHDTILTYDMYDFAYMQYRWLRYICQKYWEM